jgi:hypothetical protein
MCDRLTPAAGINIAFSGPSAKDYKRIRCRLTLREERRPSPVKNPSEKSMPIPRSLKSLLPSFRLEGNETAIISVADLKALLPSLNISDRTISLSIGDLQRVLKLALEGVKLDEKWYLGQVPELRRDIARGKFKSTFEHYYMHGYLEGRLPECPTVDEYYYLKTYQDVADGIKIGRVKNAVDHYVQSGYVEGRQPSPPNQPGHQKYRQS